MKCQMSGPISEEGVLRRLLQQMNRQAPSQRIRVSELLRMSEPGYVGKDGEEYFFSVDELRVIKESLDVLGYRDIRLPIVLMADSSQEQSVWRVEGEVECALVCNLIDKESRTRTDRLFLYAPHVSMLRRKVPTCTVCLFMP